MSYFFLSDKDISAIYKKYHITVDSDLNKLVKKMNGEMEDFLCYLQINKEEKINLLQEFKKIIPDRTYEYVVYFINERINPILLNQYQYCYLLDNKNVALISDAGTPCISDPGYRIVNKANINNVKVISIPGPSSVHAALSISGLPTDNYFFQGFLPKKKGRKTKFDS